MAKLKAVKICWTGFLLANWGIIFYHWFSGSGALLSEGLFSVLIALGRLTGLVAAYMILLQFFLMGRMPWLERLYGLDKLSRLHQKNGKFGFFFLALHPILLTLGYSSLSGLNPWQQFLNFLTDYTHVLWAFAGAILFFTVITTSIYIARSRVRYEAWYFVHLMAYLAVFASFWHQISVGPDIIGNKFFYFYWIALYSAVFGSHIVFRFARPVYLFFRHDFKVDRVVRESPSAVSLYISGKNMQSFPVRPGQFMIFRFLAKKLWWQAHPFSLSMLPDGKRIRITVKELGDFTKQIKNIAPGAKVLIDGPYGVFTDLFGISPKVLFVAGGIGITPIRSLMEEMVKEGKDVALIYGNRTQGEIVFRNELSYISKQYAARVTHILSDDAAYQGETGHIDQEKIKRLVPDFLSRDIYLCGPPPMMESLIASFRNLGIPSPSIHYEKFSF